MVNRPYRIGDHVHVKGLSLEYVLIAKLTERRWFLQTVRSNFDLIDVDIRTAPGKWIDEGRYQVFRTRTGAQKPGEGMPYGLAVKGHMLEPWDLHVAKEREKNGREARA